MGEQRVKLLKLQKILGKKEAKKLSRRQRFPRARNGELESLENDDKKLKKKKKFSEFLDKLKQGE